MLNLLLSDCGCPRVLSFLPDRVAGLLKIGISEHPYSYCDQLGALLGFHSIREIKSGSLRASPNDMRVEQIAVEL
jgi:hypothetical protein